MREGRDESREELLARGVAFIGAGIVPRMARGDCPDEKIF